MTLAYLFWHWRRDGVDAPAYEARQRAFHGRPLRHTEDAIKYAVDNGLDAMYVTEDTTRSRPEVLTTLFRTAPFLEVEGASILIYLLMAVVLLWRPEGLFGKRL